MRILKIIFWFLMAVFSSFWAYAGYLAYQEYAVKRPKLVSKPGSVLDTVCQTGFYLYKQDLLGSEKFVLKGCRFHKVGSGVGEDLYRGWVQYTSPLSEFGLMAFMTVAYVPDTDIVRLCASKLAFDQNEDIRVDASRGICQGSKEYLVDYPSK